MRGVDSVVARTLFPAPRVRLPVRSSDAVGEVNLALLAPVAKRGRLVVVLAACHDDESSDCTTARQHKMAEVACCRTPRGH